MQTFPEIGELIFRPCRTIRRGTGTVYEKLVPELAETGRKDTPYRTNIVYIPTYGLWTIGARKGLVAFITALPDDYTHFRVIKAVPNAVTLAPCDPDQALLYAAFPKFDPEVLGLGQLREVAKRHASELVRYLPDDLIVAAVSRSRVHDILVNTFSAGVEVNDIMSLKGCLDAAQLYAGGVEAAILEGGCSVPKDQWSRIMQKLNSLRSDMLNSLGRHQRTADSFGSVLPLAGGSDGKDGE